ncbi:DUF402 domain-containing protein [Nocardioides sp. AX2bis]|uniref:DUF402 domain-containing protein n=1 Tax=Nocardioides sp. AX2bis TaxID=2653157 RepID=UPI0012F14F3C|nr:DUF402 domain-containing protein [Nocardioides sp. AX2bis]VXC07939.1 conserved hypothetical protein [Nocardioides sp. AX2bis]
MSPHDAPKPGSPEPGIPEPGTPVHVAMAKWGDRAHWEFDAVVLGHDEHGTWLGMPAGTPHARPGMAFVSDVASVTLVPAAGAWALASFHAPGIWCRTYVDVATPATWDPTGDVPVLRAVDLDLDVVRGEHGRVWVDDEDEFAEHRVTLGYPPEVVTAAQASVEAVLAAVTTRTPPYDDRTATAWLERLSRPADGSAR